MTDIDADWIDCLTAERHAAAVDELIRLIDTETCYRVNLWVVLRKLPPHELRTLLNVFEQMKIERTALD